MADTCIQPLPTLTREEIETWRALCAADPMFASPLLGPDFALAVSAHRPDLRVAVWRRDGTPFAFLPHHPAGADAPARPVGGALSDYHALISPPLNAGEGPALLAQAGLGGFRYSGLIDPYRLFAATAAHEAHRIVIGGGAQAYLEAVRAASPKKFKNYRRLDHKLDREVGALRLAVNDLDRTAFDQLVAWKSEQLHRTGGFDFLAPAWTRSLLTDLFAPREGPLQGLMITLYAGDRLIAGHFGIRLGEVYHPWIASTDPEMAAWSPGQIFLLRVIEAMPELGLTTYDLGPGHDHYKRPYAFSQVMIGEGVTLSARAGWLPGAIEGAWALAGAAKGGMVGRVRRRIEAIASAETSAQARLRGLIQAAARSGRPPHAGAD